MLRSNEPRFTKGLLPTARLLAGARDIRSAKSGNPIKGSKREKTLADRMTDPRAQLREQRNAQPVAPGEAGCSVDRRQKSGQRAHCHLDWKEVRVNRGWRRRAVTSDRGEKH